MAIDLGAHPTVVALAVLHAASLAASLPASWRNRRGFAHPGLLFLTLAFAVNFTLITWQWIDYGRPPFKTLFETMVFYPLCVSAVTLMLVRLHGIYLLVPLSAAICLSGLGYALYRPDIEVVNLPPALQSAWFVPHVVTYFIAYSALFAASALAVLELARLAWFKDRAESFEHHANQTAIFGLVALTLGLIMGGVWGKFAWGDYWSWDPKENWALVTWLAYLLYFHLRRLDGWQGRRGMIVLTVVFGAVVFTYLGMSFLPQSNSLHMYQG